VGLGIAPGTSRGGGRLLEREKIGTRLYNDVRFADI